MATNQSFGGNFESRESLDRILDTELISAFLACGDLDDRREFAEEIFGVFISQTRDLLGRCRSANLSRDYGERARIIHRLKGSAGNVGALLVSEEAAAVERAATDSQEYEVSLAIARLEAAVELTINQIGAFLAGM